MDNNKITAGVDSSERKSKRIWKNIGIGALAVLLALFTVIVINL